MTPQFDIARRLVAGETPKDLVRSGYRPRTVAALVRRHRQGTLYLARKAGIVSASDVGAHILDLLAEGRTPAEILAQGFDPTRVSAMTRIWRREQNKAAGHDSSASNPGQNQTFLSSDQSSPSSASPQASGPSGSEPPLPPPGLADVVAIIREWLTSRVPLWERFLHDHPLDDDAEPTVRAAWDELEPWMKGLSSALSGVRPYTSRIIEAEFAVRYRRGGPLPLHLRCAFEGDLGTAKQPGVPATRE